jgi:3-hydroxyisobutyrate dehydrogenase
MPRMSDAIKVSFIGLGVMGGAIARHIGRAGYALTIYNRTRSRIDVWHEANPDIDVRVANNPADAAKDADVVITCVGNDDDLADVVLGPQGVFKTLRQGGTFVDHTTVSARIARQISVEARDLHIHCVDAPMTGSQIGAESGTLTLMCGGRKSAIDAARPVMESYSKAIVHVGKAGSGQTAKMANQICIAGIVASLAEAVRFAQASHLDMDRVYEAISGGAAQSWQMDNRLKSMDADEFDFGFAVDWMRKDLGLAMDEGRGLGVSLPMTALINQFYADVQAMGGGRLDTSAIIKRLPLRGRK